MPAKQLYIYILLLMLLAACTNGHRELTVISFNLRYDNVNDGINSWSNRKQLLNQFLEGEQPDVIGFQEVLGHQLEDVKSFMPLYTSIEAGRDDGVSKGEMTPIFFKKGKYDLLASSHFWLSDTPDIPGSMSWGTLFPRIVTWVKLRDIASGYIFYVFNTHLSHVSEYARNQSASLLLEKIRVLAGKAPVVLMGDFNGQPDDRMYKTITGHWDGYIPMWDTRFESLNVALNPPGTFNGFGSNTDEVIIDHIFVNNLFSTVNFDTYPVIQDGVFISDHYPIKAVLIFGLKSRKKLTNSKPLIPSVPKPVFESNDQIFVDHMFVPLKVPGNSAKIYFTTDGSTPDTTSTLYIAPIELTSTSTINAFAYSDEKFPSMMVSRRFVKKVNTNYKVQAVIPKPTGKYALDNYFLLTDGKMGGKQADDKSWLGVEGGDVDIVIVFDRVSIVNDVHVSVLNDAENKVLAPSSIKVSISNDGINYRAFDQYDLTPSSDVRVREKHIVSLSGNDKGRFVKVELGNSGLMPSHHQAAGSLSWLFTDEIVVD